MRITSDVNYTQYNYPRALKALIPPRLADTKCWVCFTVNHVMVNPKTGDYVSSDECGTTLYEALSALGTDSEIYFDVADDMHVADPIEYVGIIREWGAMELSPKWIYSDDVNRLLDNLCIAGNLEGDYDE